MVCTLWGTASWCGAWAFGQSIAVYPTRFPVTQFFRFDSVRSSLLALGAFGAGWFRSTVSLGVLLIMLAGAVLSPVRSLAQSASTGTVSGNVADSQGSSVVNATVTLTSIDEGTVTAAKVNERGEYLFSDVKAGGYILTVSAPTFENFTADSVTVNATENIRLDAKLTRGSAKDTVTVEAPSATVDTRSATVAAVIDPTLVQNLPIDGNNVIALTALLPGVTGVNAPTTFTSDTAGPAYIVSGSRANQNMFLFDNILWNNVYYNTGLNFPPQFMIQELSVQLVNFKAQYGRNVGSVLNVLTRSGTNQIHGSVWEYAENSALDARDYITGLNPKLVQNQFGATIGGPILRDKLFYFLGWQDLRVSQEVVSDLSASAVPSDVGLTLTGQPRPCVTTAYGPNMYCANFTNNFYPNLAQLSPVPPATTPAAGLANPLYITDTYNPIATSQLLSTGGITASMCYPTLFTLGLTQQYFPNQEIPTYCFNPVVQTLYNKYISIPNILIPASGSEYGGQSTAMSPRNDQQGLARVDWILPRHTIDARFYVTNVNDTTSNAVSPTSNAIAPYEEDANAAGIYNGNIGDTWVVTPNLLNVARISYKRYNYTIYPTDPTTLNNLGSAFVQPGHPELPRISVSFAFTLGGSTTGYSNSLNAGYEADDSFTLTHGNHNFQFGGQYLDLNYIHRFDQVPYFDFGNEFTTIGVSDFFLGLVYNETVGNTTNISAAEHATYFYAQDDWRATPRLTLNLGIRYELPKPWYQQDQQSVSWIPGYQSYRFLNTPSSLAFQGDPGVPSSIIKTTYDNLAPRFGFAYDVFGNGKTAVRGGFGIFFDALNANTVGIGQPYHYTASYQEAPGSISNPLLGLSPVPVNYTTPANATFGTPLSVNFADPNVTEPYTEAVNFGFQQKVGLGTLEVLYVGKFGRHQIVPYDLNPDIYDCTGAYFQANPATYCTDAAANQASDTARVRYAGFNYGGAGIVDNNSVGSSNYNGLQAIFTQRARANLTMTASYTYSRSLDDQSSGTTNSSALSLPPNVNNNYGPSDFNAQQVFNMGWVLKLPAVSQGSRVERAILNDWVFSGIFNAKTGSPFNVTTTSDYQLNDEPNQRPPLISQYSRYQAENYGSNRHRADRVKEWYNICAFKDGNTKLGNQNNCGSDPNYATTSYAISPGYTNGISRNLLVGPAFIDTDMGLQRIFSIPIRDRMQFRVRADAINAFNTPNLANPVSSVSGSASTANSTDHGQILATVGKNGGVGTNGRRIQISLLLTY